MRNILEILVTYISILLGCTAVYIFFNYGKISLEQIFFIDETILQMDWVKQVVLIIILVSLVLTFILSILKLKVIKIVLLLASISFFIFTFSILEYLKYNISYSDFYENEYRVISPKEVSFPKNKKNLIIIYLESMEQEYSRNVKPYLDALQSKSTSFSGYKHLESVNTTIASQFSSLCGLPLKSVLKAKDLKNFMPTVACVPDILKQAGYNLSYLKAADIDFSNARSFAEQHSFDNIKGYDELSSIMKKKFNNIDGNKFGGLRDKVLFEAAKFELKNMQQPFMLTLTTLDMHSTPENYVDEDCYRKFGNVKDDAVYCVDNNVRQFMEWLQRQDFYDNTAIILVGDHITPSMHHRKAAIFNVIVNHAKDLVREKHAWTTYDLAPTILNSIGVDVPHLGIGRSLFEKNKTLFEKYGNNFHFMLMAKNRMYDDFMSRFNENYSYKSYTLGKLLTNQETSRYIDIGKASFCYKTTTMTMNIGKNIPEKMQLETDIKSFAETYNITFNGKTIFSNRNPISQNRNIKIPINKDWIKDDGRVIIEIVFKQYNRSRNEGICFDNFVLK